ncbi:hypothetical protein HK098_006719 [Nowakowskiella sp. JEL0407]|nr:hypothetical protein HK098_006719 [Nowakowskiella sp. JEL0407]
MATYFLTPQELLDAAAAYIKQTQPLSFPPDPLPTSPPRAKPPSDLHNDAPVLLPEHIDFWALVDKKSTNLNLQPQKKRIDIVNTANNSKSPTKYKQKIHTTAEAELEDEGSETDSDQASDQDDWLATKRSEDSETDISDDFIFETGAKTFREEDTHSQTSEDSDKSGDTIEIKSSVENENTLLDQTTVVISEIKYPTKKRKWEEELDSWMFD